MKTILLKTFTLLLLVFICETTYTQPLFKRNDRVCFVGNSITNNGEFYHNILLYQLTRFPMEKVLFYNCGISGDRTGGILARFDDDIMVHKPTHAVMMIGMNDVSRTLYPLVSTENADTLKLQKYAIELHKKNLEQIVKQFLDRKIHVTLQKPSIYDQTAKLDLPASIGVNDALKTCADFMESLAQNSNCKRLNIWTLITMDLFIRFNMIWMEIRYLK